MTEHTQHQYVADEIRRRIETGEWATHHQTGGLDGVATEFGVSLDIAERAISALESEGYSRVVRGWGVRLQDSVLRTRRPRGNLVKRNKQELGYAFSPVSSQETWWQHGQADVGIAKIHDGRVAALLAVPVGSSVMRCSLVTGPMGEAPFHICTTWIHPRVAELIADLDKQPPASDWLHTIEQAGHWPIGWIEFHRARVPTDTETRLLGIEASLPILEVARLARSGADSKPVGVTECIIPSDRVELVSVLRRDPSAQEPWPAKHGDGDERL